MAVADSSLYECVVMHHRLEPQKHAFRYRFFMFSLDLDELDACTGRVWGFSRNRRGVYEFRDSDHPVPGVGDLKSRLLAWLDKSGRSLPADTRVTLLTLPRVFGYIFNPVSFYFCCSPGGAPLQAVAEVGNTFGEIKLFALGAPDPQGRFHLTEPKNFYVSPFSALDLSFDFRLRLPEETLSVRIDDLDKGRRVFLSALEGRRVPLTTARLAWLTIKCPLVTTKIIALIHWHALLLWIKRVPLHRKAAGQTLQQEVLRPHISLKGGPS